MITVNRVIINTRSIEAPRWQESAGILHFVLTWFSVFRSRLRVRVMAHQLAYEALYPRTFYKSYFMFRVRLLIFALTLRWLTYDLAMFGLPSADLAAVIYVCLALISWQVQHNQVKNAITWLHADIFSKKTHSASYIRCVQRPGSKWFAPTAVPVQFVVEFPNKRGCYAVGLHFHTPIFLGDHDIFFYSPYDRFMLLYSADGPLPEVKRPEL